MQKLLEYWKCRISEETGHKMLESPNAPVKINATLHNFSLKQLNLERIDTMAKALDGTCRESESEENPKDI